MSSTLSPATGLEPALRAILGDALAPGDASQAVDGLVPRWVATPGSADALAAVLAAADEQGAAVVPWGGGRHMALGNVPARYDLALRTTKLDRVLEYEAADLTVTVEAGITFGSLQAALHEHGQFLPIDAPPASTVGGVLAAGASGPSRHAYGLPRDWLIGSRVAHVDGTVSKGGGRVVKNVAGYDLPKLAVGALGTLGVIVEATFKVAPLPPAQETLIVDCVSLEAAAELVFAGDDRGLALHAVALRQSREGALAAFWLAGPLAAVERTRRELGELAGSGQTRQLEAAASDDWWAALNDETAPDGGMTLRAALAPSAVLDFMRRLSDLGHEAGVVLQSSAYATTGLVLARTERAPAERLAGVIEEARRATDEQGGSLVVTAAPVEAKRRVDVWGDPSPGSGQAPAGALPLMRRLKEQFDPRGTLNPGRFVGGL